MTDQEESQASTAESARPARSRGRIWTLRLLAVLVSLTVLIGIPEIVVRIVQPELRAFRGMRFGGDPNSHHLFVKDSQLHWRLRADVSFPFLATTVRTDHRGFRVEADAAGPDAAGSDATGADAAGSDATGSDDDEARHVLFLGDSITFGWRVEQRDSFSSVVPHLLNQDPGRKWVGHNAASPGYSSHQTRLVAEEWIPRLKPDVVVVLTGTNDLGPGRAADSDLAKTRSTYVGLLDVLDHSDFLTWAAESLRSEMTAEEFMADKANAVRRVSLPDLQANLAAITRLAEKHGATPILVVPPVNLYDPPESFVNAGLATMWDRARSMVKSGDTAGAIAMMDAVVAKRPQDLDVLWLRGMAASMAPDWRRGTESLLAAFDMERFPNRANSQYSAGIAEKARELGVPIVDPNGLFLRGRRGPATRRLFFDSCHLVPEGHRILGAELARVIAQLPE